MRGVTALLISLPLPFLAPFVFVCFNCGMRQLLHDHSRFVPRCCQVDITDLQIAKLMQLDITTTIFRVWGNPLFGVLRLSSVFGVLCLLCQASFVFRPFFRCKFGSKTFVFRRQGLFFNLLSPKSSNCIRHWLPPSEKPTLY